MSERKFECWFLDVAQGSSNVIYLGDGKAIVIDCGADRSNTTLSFLKKNYVTTIEALIVSHNHDDHDGNLANILSNYNGSIKSFYFLRDGHHKKTIGLLKSYGDAVLNVRRLEADETIFSQNDIALSVIFPNVLENMDSEDSPNETCSILKLEYGNSRILFGGDAGIEAWRKIKERRAIECPYNCDILTVPHHGGKLSENSSQNDHQELYTQIVKPKYAIISVGTSNQHNHPNKNCIRTLVDNNCKVLCTQMTKQCCSDLEKIRNFQRTITQPSASNRKEDRTSSARHSRNVACFGTVTSLVCKNEASIDTKGFDLAKDFFNTIPNYTPLCHI